MALSPHVRSAAAALLWAMGLLVWSAWSAYSEAINSYASARVTASIAQSDLWRTSFRADAIAFALALVGLHVALAVLIWVIARIAALAYPKLQPRLGLVAFAIGATVFVWVLVANAQWYPWSRWVSAAGWLKFAIGGEIGSYHVLTLMICGVALLLAGGAIANAGRYRKFWVRAIVYSMSVGICLWLWGIRTLVAGEAHVSDAHPHVIIIGIDSLRPDVAGLGQRIALTPNLDRFAAEASVFTDAVTPLARTFPSWVSILTGHNPVRTGARENLISPDALSLPPTLPALLRARGYRTYYGTDEVRFSNIDERYGFDEIIGPRMGATDFLLAPVSDMPLPNLVANTALGRWLFPNVYANRAAAVTYRSETFIQELDRRLDFSVPAFVAVHLALPHWPYHWAASEKEFFDDTNATSYAYAAAVVEVDRQLGQFLNVLDRKGALQNSIVVVLSDHGEALGLPRDNLIHSKEAKQAAGRVIVNMLGHGNSVLSPSQYGVFLAFRSFGQANVAHPMADSVLDAPVSLEDVTPTLLALVGAEDPVRRDGVSLMGLLCREFDAYEAMDSRLRFTETGITVGFTREGQVDVQELVDKNMRYYEVNASTARIELNSAFIPALMLAKERAVVSRDWLLAAIPDEAPGSYRYLLVSRKGGPPRILIGAPDRAIDSEAHAMWTALHKHFGDELPDGEAL